MVCPLPASTPFEARLGWIPSGVARSRRSARRCTRISNDDVRSAGVRANPYAELLDTSTCQGRLAGRDPVNQALYIWARTQLPNYVLSYLGDRMEMAHSVEGACRSSTTMSRSTSPVCPSITRSAGCAEKHVLREAVRDWCCPRSTTDRSTRS